MFAKLKLWHSQLTRQTLDTLEGSLTGAGSVSSEDGGHHGPQRQDGAKLLLHPDPCHVPVRVTGDL